MATGTSRTVTIIRHEFILPTDSSYGAASAELSKVWAWATTSWEEAHPGQTMYDDSIRVRSTDEEVTLFWQEEVVD